MQHAEKHDYGKADYTYLSRDFLEGMVRVRAFGAKKYSRDGWLKGFPIRKSLAAAFRHGWAFLWGEDNDPESGECHLFHMACSIEHAVNDYLHHPQNDDRFKQPTNNLERKVD